MSNYIITQLKNIYQLRKSHILTERKRKKIKINKIHKPLKIKINKINEPLSLALYIVLGGK